jgi:hypothetical protein
MTSLPKEDFKDSSRSGFASGKAVVLAPRKPASRNFVWIPLGRTLSGPELLGRHIVQDMMLAAALGGEPRPPTLHYSERWKQIPRSRRNRADRLQRVTRALISPVEANDEKEREAKRNKFTLSSL